MLRFLYLLLAFGLPGLLLAQSNILVTNQEADDILHGDFNPADYAPSMVIDDAETIAAALLDEINTDSLLVYLEEMSAFGNRNTGSDTTSMNFGIGAARKWAFEKFELFSSQNENRLVTSYLQFDQEICDMGQHRNIFTVLPGQGPNYQEVVLLEAHFDSRCETVCDVDCIAHGMEDNGSGSALILELARIMGQFSFDRTIVFVLTIGEEQGLFGADAFSKYIKDEDIALRAVLNNDIVGGIVCGETASPPGCPGLNDIDSINVRIYSQGSLNSRNKQLARFVKLEYHEMVRDLMPVQPVINIMTNEDRTGRGGDHIPFRADGFPAVRFTSANEHGDAGTSDPDYHDRQHTMEDILGVDTDNDGQLDSFFVDFNYLARNSVLNGTAAIVAAAGPATPLDFDLTIVDNAFLIEVDDPAETGNYRVGIRLFDDNDWLEVRTYEGAEIMVEGLEDGVLYVLSVAAVDDNGLESLFSNERFGTFNVNSTVELPLSARRLDLLQNNPNPFDEATTIGVLVEERIDYQQAQILVHDLDGKELAKLPIQLDLGINTVEYDYRYHRYQPGTYAYSLVVDNQLVATKQMIYAY